ncbi:MAG: hypothetical protein R3B90_06050 [Planctomycetaceae bacterium]
MDGRRPTYDELQARVIELESRNRMAAPEAGYSLAVFRPRRFHRPAADGRRLGPMHASM